MCEIWKLVGRNTKYSVSNKGNVRNNKTGRILKQSINSKGYKQVVLYNKGERITVVTHRLVAEAFIPNPENKPQIDHKNTIRTDCNVDNLRWVTPRENNLNPLTNLKRINTLRNRPL